MPGLTPAEAAATLDVRFPVTGATDYIAWSSNGTSETANLARTFIGATGWAAATVSDPSYKSNANALTTAAASGAVSPSHFCVMNAATGGTQRTEWTALDVTQVLTTGGQLSIAAGGLKVGLT